MSKYQNQSIKLIDEFDTGLILQASFESDNSGTGDERIHIKASYKTWRKFMCKLTRERRWANVFKLTVDKGALVEYVKIATVFLTNWNEKEYQIFLTPAKPFDVFYAKKHKHTKWRWVGR